MTRTPILSTYWRLGRFTLYLALFCVQDSLSGSQNSSAPCSENVEREMLWNVPRLGFPMYVVCIISGSSNAQVIQTGLWSRVTIATELGCVLRMMGPHTPHGHGAFSELVFGQDSVGAEVINEGDCEGGDVSHEEGERSQSHTIHEQAVGCGYLEDDDIEDW